MRYWRRLRALTRTRDKSAETFGFSISCPPSDQFATQTRLATALEPRRKHLPANGMEAWELELRSFPSSAPVVCALFTFFRDISDFFHVTPPKTFALFHALSRYFTKFRALALIFFWHLPGLRPAQPGLHFPS